MIVAVITMRVVQMPVDQVIGVITVGDGFVPAFWAMLVSGCVRLAIVSLCAIGRIDKRHFDGVLVHMTLMGVVQVAIMQIVDMIVVLYGGVPAVVSMFVSMLLVNGVVRHRYSFHAFRFSPGRGSWSDGSARRRLPRAGVLAKEEVFRCRDLKGVAYQNSVGAAALAFEGKHTRSYQKRYKQESRCTVRPRNAEHPVHEQPEEHDCGLVHAEVSLRRVRHHGLAG